MSEKKFRYGQLVRVIRGEYPSQQFTGVVSVCGNQACDVLYNGSLIEMQPLECCTLIEEPEGVVESRREEMRATPIPTLPEDV